MNELAITFRCAQFVAHNAHNLAQGCTFFEDHEMLGELYGAYESAYDSVVERIIGSGKDIDLNAVTMEAAKRASEVKFNGVMNTERFVVLLNMEEIICGWVKTYLPSSTIGTQNLLQGLADESEARQYKLKRRVMGA